MGKLTLHDDDMMSATLYAMLCMGLGVVISVVLLVFALLSICFAFFPAIIIPAVTVPERNFDKRFHGATCEFVGVVAVAGSTETQYYPEFNLTRKGVSKGIGVPFKKCKKGKKCERSALDGEQSCEWKLKHVSCNNFKTPQGQTNGTVDWNNGEYQVGQVYDCEITNSGLEKVQDELGCTTWPDDMGCAMMDRSRPPNALDDETFWAVMWAFVFGPLLAAAASLLAIVPTLAAFLSCSLFVWVSIAGVILCVKAVWITAQKADDTIKNYDKENVQTEPSLPPQNDASDIEEVGLEEQV